MNNKFLIIIFSCRFQLSKFSGGSFYLCLCEGFEVSWNFGPRIPGPGAWALANVTPLVRYQQAHLPTSIRLFTWHKVMVTWLSRVWACYILRLPWSNPSIVAVNCSQWYVCKRFKFKAVTYFAHPVGSFAHLELKIVEIFLSKANGFGDFKSWPGQRQKKERGDTDIKECGSKRKSGGCREKKREEGRDWVSEVLPGASYQPHLWPQGWAGDTSLHCNSLHCLALPLNRAE